MNGSAVAATSGITGNIATIIVWMSNSMAHGDWFPVDSGTAISIATILTAAVGAFGVTSWNKATKSKTTDSVSVETSKS
jgi:hypothetical protein